MLAATSRFPTQDAQVSFIALVTHCLVALEAPSNRKVTSKPSFNHTAQFLMAFDGQMGQAQSRRSEPSSSVKPVKTCKCQFTQVHILCALTPSGEHLVSLSG